MNYLETGLPHTDFCRRNTDFRPPRYIPLCSLGRKYLGLEPLTRDEVKNIIARLCQPKHVKHDQECVDKPPREEEPSSNPTRRFVGRKRMSSFEIEKMVERLYSQRKTKDFQFVDDTFDTRDFINMTNRDDSDDDADDDVFKAKTDNKNSSDSSSSSNNNSNKSNTLLTRRQSCLDKVSTREVTQTDNMTSVPGDKSTSATESESAKIVRRQESEENVFCSYVGLNPRTRPLHSPFGKVTSYKSYQRNDSLQQIVESETINNTKSLPTDQARQILNSRRSGRIIKTAEPWTKRTETVSRQINRVRRPLSNPQVESYRSLSNMKQERSPRPEYAVARSGSCLPSLHISPRLLNTQRANQGQTATEDLFIEQVASSNTPRQR